MMAVEKDEDIAKKVMLNVELFSKSLKMHLFLASTQFHILKINTRTKSKPKLTLMTKNISD